MNIEDKMHFDITSINQPIGTLATINGSGEPETATLYYILDKNLRVYFITRDNSRKYINITNNPHVAFSISSEHPPKDFQIKGIASKVTEATEENENFSKLIAVASESMTMPPVSQIGGGQIIFMKIEPKWIRAGSFEISREGDKFVEMSIK